MNAWLILAITTILIVIAFLILDRNIRVRTSQQTALDEIKREVGAIITELNATTERNIQLIEDRISTLEKLLEQADRKVGALRRHLSTHGDAGASGSEAYDRLGRTQHEQPRDLPDGPRVSEPPPDSFFVSRTGAVGQDPTPEDPAAVRVALRERVRGLYLQGFSLDRIASIVGKTVGEVELIVSLNEGTER